MKLNQQGFTLTELLVVVVIIAILAAVVLPKYNKVLDTYKIAEAEQMLEMVRNEQEGYFELDGAYRDNPKDVDAFPSNTNPFVSKNFSYSMGGGAISATSVNQEYTYILTMHYDTGEITCTSVSPSDACEKLNRNF